MHTTKKNFLLLEGYIWPNPPAGELPPSHRDVGNNGHEMFKTILVSKIKNKFKGGPTHKELHAPMSLRIAKRHLTCMKEVRIRNRPVISTWKSIIQNPK